MKIDRHNYEECFLLYVDNELTVEQRNQVELFVQENPDLEEELVMLQQSRLVPEPIVFEGKHLLMKEEGTSFINLHNYEEWLVLYVDNELAETEKIAVEKFVAAHPHVRAELDLFKQTKLQPEQVSFPDKNLLYRNKKRAGVITMTWWRVAVAAILILVATFTFYSIFIKKNKVADRIVKIEEQPIQNHDKSIEPKTEQQSERNSETVLEKQHIAVTSLPTDKPKERDSKKTLANNSPASNDLVVDNKSYRPRVAIVNEINAVEQKDALFADIKVPVTHKQIFNGDSVTPGDSEPPYLAENTDTDKKLRGLFRKATRFIERTSGINPANDDNRVLIGGMAINLK